MTDSNLHIMVDLETMGVSNDAAILSIGAVLFDPHHIVDQFHLRVDLEGQASCGRTMDASTIMWWLTPDKADARANLLALRPVSLDSALSSFSVWFGETSLPLWGNGATFDNVILRSAFKGVGLKCPWGFWHDRCYRTVKALAPDVPLVREGVHHDALADALSQTRHLQVIWDKLGVVG